MQHIGRFGSAIPYLIASALALAMLSALYTAASTVNVHSTAALIEPARFLPPPAPMLGSWYGGTPYPTPVYGNGCAAYNGYIYCTGGQNATIGSYYAQIANGGSLGAWHPTTAYPANMSRSECAAGGGYMYCVDGDTGQTYYASITGTGIGGWIAGAALPMGNATGVECTASSTTLYCVGGYTPSAFGGTPKTSYYAQMLGSAGLSSWSATTPYPGNFGHIGCTVYNQTIYCVGGSADINGHFNDTGAAYYAPILGGGAIGAWGNATSQYPQSVADPNCDAEGGYLYCIGGSEDISVGGYGALLYATSIPQSYMARITSSGFGNWSQTTSYVSRSVFYETTGIESSSCPEYDGYVYCIGGQNAFYTISYTNATYYARLQYNASSTSSVQPVVNATQSMMNDSWAVQTQSNLPSMLMPNCMEVGGLLWCIGGLAINTSYMTGSFQNATALRFSPVLWNGSLGSWMEGKLDRYPNNTAGQTCVSSNFYIICTGGEVGVVNTSGVRNVTDIVPTNATFYGRIYPGSAYYSGGELLTRNASMLSGFTPSGCASWSQDFITCSGNYTNGGTTTNVTYNYTFGGWNAGQAYPLPSGYHVGACTSSYDHVYCIGGSGHISQLSSYRSYNSSYTNLTYSDAVFYASVNSSGMGQWRGTTPYPMGISGEGCAVYNGYVYCIGGGTTNNNNTDTAYYAKINADGSLGAWLRTTNYTYALTTLRCAADNGYVFCFGGASSLGAMYHADRYAAITQNGGVAQWRNMSNYPMYSLGLGCAPYGYMMFCTGPLTSSSSSRQYNNRYVFSHEIPYAPQGPEVNATTFPPQNSTTTIYGSSAQGQGSAPYQSGTGGTLGSSPNASPGMSSATTVGVIVVIILIIAAAFFLTRKKAPQPAQKA